MEAKLVVIGGAARPSEFKLKLPTIIGRSRTVDLPVGHPLVSRQHCELFAEGDLLKIRDLGSLNGTFVGETRIAEDTVLEPGDEFTVGPLTFKAVYGKMPVTAPAGDDDADLSPPTAKAAAEDSGHGAPPQFDDEEPAVGLTTVVGDVATPVDHATEPVGEDDFSLAFSPDDDLAADFDSAVDIPQPALSRGKKSPAEKVSQGKSTAGKSDSKAEKGKRASDKAKPAKEQPAEAAKSHESAGEPAAEDDANEFAPPPHKHGASHGDPDIDNLLDFLQ